MNETTHPSNEVFPYFFLRENSIRHVVLVRQILIMVDIIPNPLQELCFKVEEILNFCTKTDLRMPEFIIFVFVRISSQFYFLIYAKNTENMDFSTKMDVRNHTSFKRNLFKFNF